MSILQVSSVSKLFPKKTALSNVSMKFEGGKRYTILGENGAGKSTLASILAGLKSPDTGELIVNGSPVFFSSASDAQKKKIVMIQQQPSVAMPLTVLDNVILGAEPCVFPGIIRKKTARREVEKLISDWQLDVSPDRKAAELSAPQLFYTALLSALYKKPDWLILDEPSASLDEQQKKSLFAAIKRFTEHEEKRCVIFITHNLKEAADNADKIYILKKGILTDELNSASEQQLKNLLFGSSAENNEEGCILKEESAPDKKSAVTDNSDSAEKKEDVLSSRRNENYLELENVSAFSPEGAPLRNISFKLKYNSITCITGQRKNGLATLEYLLTGTKPVQTEGTIYFRGEKIKKLTTDFLRKNQTSIVPFDRKNTGASPDLTVRELLASYTDTQQNRAEVEKQLIKNARVDASYKTLVSELSGGMLQRLILERELLLNPKLLILSSPEYGLDSQGITELEKKLIELKKNGITLFILTTENALLQKICDYNFKLENGKLEPA